MSRFDTFGGAAYYLVFLAVVPNSAEIASLRLISVQTFVMDVSGMRLLPKEMLYVYL